MNGILHAAGFFWTTGSEGSSWNEKRATVLAGASDAVEPVRPGLFPPEKIPRDFLIRYETGTRFWSCGDPVFCFHDVLPCSRK